MTPGAERTDVLRMVIYHALRLFGAGLAVGLPAAWLTSRWVTSLDFFRRCGPRVWTRRWPCDTSERGVVANPTQTLGPDSSNVLPQAILWYDHSDRTNARQIQFALKHNS